MAALLCLALAHLLRVTSTLAEGFPTSLENEAQRFTDFRRQLRELPLKNLSFSNIKTTFPKVIQTMSRLKPHKKYKLCICDPLKKDCRQLAPKVEITRQQTLEKVKKGRYKTYLDSIAEKDKKFCRTSTTEKPAKKKGKKCTRTTLSSTRTTPSVCGYSSTVFIGVIGCPLNNAKIGYFLWVRPNRRKFSVKAKCHKGKHIEIIKQMPVFENQ